MSRTTEPFFKIRETRVPNSKRATKKNTKQDKFKRNGKYTSKGTRAKQSILQSTQRASEDMNQFSPRETVVGTVLNRDKMQSIALPPKLQKDPLFKMSKNLIKEKPKPRPSLNASDV